MEEEIFRGAGQIIPMTRSAVYSSFLTATPRLMEPVMISEIICPEDCIEPLAETRGILNRRRAHIVDREPIEGTPLFKVQVEVPAIESFGFETDIRSFTVGQAMILSRFHKWRLAPGNPLDKSIELRLIEPNEINHLAREFMVKTRRRKGLVEDFNVTKFFEHPETLEQARQDRDLKPYFTN